MVESADTIETALDIRCSASEDLILDDSRRLTGPGLLWSHVGANLDVLCPSEHLDQVIPVWRQQARRVLDAIGWKQENVSTLVQTLRCPLRWISFIRPCLPVKQLGTLLRHNYYTPCQTTLTS